MVLVEPTSTKIVRSVDAERHSCFEQDIGPCLHSKVAFYVSVFAPKKSWCQSALRPSGDSSTTTACALKKALSRISPMYGDPLPVI